MHNREWAAKLGVPKQQEESHLNDHDVSRNEILAASSSRIFKPDNYDDKPKMINRRGPRKLSKRDALNGVLNQEVFSLKIYFVQAFFWIFF